MLVLVEPKNKNECKIYFFSAQFSVWLCVPLVCVRVCVCVCGCWHEGQTDKRSRWYPGGCCRVGGRCPFTIHVPSALATGD